MGLEVASFLNDLVSANPIGSDGKSQGDDHLRLLKTVLKATFPLATAARKFGDATNNATDTLTWLLYRSRNGVAGDLVGSYAIAGNDGAGNETVIARMQAKWLDPTNGSEDSSILFKAQVGGVETILMEMISFRPVTRQEFTADGTWTKPQGCRKVMIRGSGAGAGGGAGGGNVPGLHASAGGGGGGGFSGWSDFIDVTAVANGAVVIGAGGAGGTLGGNGVAGGNTTITLGATTYTFAGGPAGNGITADVRNGVFGNFSSAATGTNVRGRGIRGLPGFWNLAENFAIGGEGGGTIFGSGGLPGRQAVSGSHANGSAGTNFGSGGGGGAQVNSSDAGDGGAGAGGILQVWEFY